MKQDNCPFFFELVFLIFLKPISEKTPNHMNIFYQHQYRDWKNDTMEKQQIKGVVVGEKQYVVQQCVGSAGREY